jgi:polyisoprenoid-binding protein YceI
LTPRIHESRLACINLSAPVRGDFHRFSGTIEVDREHPERSSVTARISVASLDTKIQKRDHHLLSPEFFDAAKFPEITFKSRSVKQTGRK